MNNKKVAVGALLGILSREQNRELKLRTMVHDSGAFRLSVDPIGLSVVDENGDSDRAYAKLLDVLQRTFPTT